MYTPRHSLPDRQLSAAEIHQHVPPDWYYQSISVQRNPFQRFWHSCRFREVGKLVEPTGGKILDVGCADGVFTQVILEKSNASEIVGIDVLPASVDWANEHWKHTGRMRFQVADAHALPFPDHSFDAVFCLEMLEHIYDPSQALREMRRVLRPGGYCVFLVPSDSLLFRVIWAVWTRLRGQIWEGTHIQSFRRGSLGQIVRKVGFCIDVERTFLLGMLYVVKGRK
ncbi:MAG: type 11 methyltransferase [Candidatus Peregrinibacteria bacterium Greene0416_19]|nr:MAG: type 11 methyltransferase [Candidatus Peregrinibacteria bacterium Greene0416_19]